MSKERKGGMGGPMGRMGGGPRAVEKAKDFKGTMKKLGVYLKPYSLSIAIVILFAIGSAAFSIVGPKILGKATTKIFEGLVQKITGVPNASIDFGYIGNIAMILVALYLVSSLFGIIQSFIMSGVAQKVSYNLRKQISEKMDTLPLNYFDTRTNGEVLSRITNDVDTVNQTLNQSLSQIITSVVTLIGVLIMMFSISWIMTLATFIILPVSMVLISLVVKKSQKYFKSQQEYLGHLNGQVEEVYGGHNIMKAFNREEASTKDFDELNNTLYKSAWKSQFLSGMMMPIMSFVGNLGYVLVSILGGWLTIKSVITVGDIQAFIQYVRSFNQPISQMAQVANIMQSTAAAAERVFEFLDEEDEVKDPVNSVDPSEIRGEVEFEDVHFGYNEDKIIINDFSVDVKPGQKVAIVGPTGAGKTTIVKLLMRFYDINSGSIKIDGHDIRDFKRADLRNLFGMVLQDTWLFNGSIKENIAYSKSDATMDEIVRAAKSARVDHFIRTLPQGYDTILTEDASNLSQGQKQLLTIARAILSDPSVLILDEATSSVDTRTEVEIQKAMNNLMKGRTSFVIAHRLSTIRDADLILVMKEGTIIEQGSHKELIEKKGFYEELYNSQFTSEYDEDVV